jgi:DNA-binding NarL/FixJ family response regulator
MRGTRAGAKGFLLKDVSLDQLAEAIRKVAAGETFIRPAVTERIVRVAGAFGKQIDSLDPPNRLTRRETEVLRMMASGFSNREIGEVLSTTEGTIKSHISSILSKMGVRDRIRAVLKGIERGDI